MVLAQKSINEPWNNKESGIDEVYIEIQPIIKVAFHPGAVRLM